MQILGRFIFRLWSRVSLERIDMTKIGINHNLSDVVWKKMNFGPLTKKLQAFMLTHPHPTGLCWETKFWPLGVCPFKFLHARDWPMHTPCLGLALLYLVILSTCCCIVVFICIYLLYLVIQHFCCQSVNKIQFSSVQGSPKILKVNIQNLAWNSAWAHLKLWV